MYSSLNFDKNIQFIHFNIFRPSLSLSRLNYHAKCDKKESMEEFSANVFVKILRVKLHIEMEE